MIAHFAKLEGEDPNYWGIVGLLHDLDYEKYPEQHCVKVVEILEANVTSGPLSIASSAMAGLCADVEPTHQMEKILYATLDELAGLITACAYMRPSKASTTWN